MVWREVLESDMEWELPKQARKEIASEMHAGLFAMPPADRIALARELLKGTDPQWCRAENLCFLACAAEPTP